MKLLNFFKSKKIVVFLLVIGVLITLLAFDILKLRSESRKQQVDGGTMSWLQAFCDKDYSTCDTYVASDGFTFTGFENTEQYVNNPVTSKIYYQFLDFVVDSIKSVKVLSIKDNKDTGYTEYEIEVSYIPYKRIGELNVDSDNLNSLMDKFSNGNLTDEEFADSIQDYYFELFKDCFSLSSEKYTTSKVLTLSEKREKNGVVFVYNTKNFIEGLISDEMYENLEVYQSSIKSKVDTVLRQY